MKYKARRMTVTDSIQNWREADGDNTYALNWPINEGSLVWEIGGYEGRWAAQMAEKYNPHIEVFEPQTWAVERMRRRFQSNMKIKIHPYGLWLDDVERLMGDYYTDGASLMKPVTQDVPACEFKSIYHELHNVDFVDVGLMNIEGAEYILLPDMIASGSIVHFNFFWCQFHDFVNNPQERTAEIYEGLSRTHDLLWDFFPTAVAWKRKQ